jgi:hypothetical protein
VGVNTQFQYTDVGVKLEITPRVHPGGQVTLKTSMEVSNVSSSSNIGGITQPVISTRKVEHTIRLMDGETSLLGGILEVSDQSTTAGTPFLGQIPLLKYLFTSTNKEKITSELVFLLIPHIVRSQELNDLNRRVFDVGTGSGIDLRMASTPASGDNPAAAASSAAESGVNQHSRCAANAEARPDGTEASARRIAATAGKHILSGDRGCAGPGHRSGSHSGELRSAGASVRERDEWRFPRQRRAECGAGASRRSFYRQAADNRSASAGSPGRYRRWHGL